MGNVITILFFNHSTLKTSMFRIDLELWLLCKETNRSKHSLYNMKDGVHDLS